jgi:glycosyltransferase involved in cell wall biosynthesis
MRSRALRVLYVQYTNPGAYPPLLHSAELLSDDGHRVRFVGIAAADDPMEIERSRGYDVRLSRPARSAWTRPFHYAWFSARVVGNVLGWRPDWVYVSDALGCPAAWCVTWFSRVGIVYHEHDSPAPPSEAASWFARLVYRARGRIGRLAAICILPSQPRADAFTAETGRQDVMTVWNTPLQREIGPARTKRSGLRLVYQGSIVPARVPMTLIEALAELPESVSLTLIGYETVGSRGHVDALRARARAIGVLDRLEWRGTVPTRDEIMRGLQAFDVGLALLPTETPDLNERSMVGASNKPFDYLSGGLALVVSGQAEWREAFVDAGFGVACRAEDASEIAAAIRWLLEHPDERLEMGRRGQTRIREAWNYDQGFAAVMGRLGAVNTVSAVTKASA